MAQGTYYLGRVIRNGVLTEESFISAIMNSPSIEVGKFSWAITDAIDQRNAEPPYVFGHLSKYSIKGSVRIVDMEERAQVDAQAENLVEASSPFIYLPEYSGIAYLHVWNQIEEEVFPRRFCAIINSAFDDFFVDCIIEAVSDYDSFVAKLRQLDKFTEISAKVNPPNPHFGRLWSSLKDYLAKRNSSELSLREKAKDDGQLDSNISSLMENLSANRDYIPETEPDITDAALLMAADGYGSGRVVGKKNGATRTISTSESRKSFRYDKDPDPETLADVASSLFHRISRDRNMEN